MCGRARPALEHTYRPDQSNRYLTRRISLHKSVVCVSRLLRSRQLSGPSASRAQKKETPEREDDEGGLLMIFSAIPGPQGLYDPSTELDSCGVAMVADILGRRSHGIVSDGLTALANLEHRRNPARC